MIRKLREILLTQYIGAMVVALLGCQAVVSLLNGLHRIIGWYVEQRNLRDLGQPVTSFNWMIVIQTGVSICFYLVASYFLARWLYPIKQVETSEELAS